MVAILMYAKQLGITEVVDFTLAADLTKKVMFNFGDCFIGKVEYEEKVLLRP